MKIKFKYVFYALLIALPYLIMAFLFLSMNTRQNIYNWLAYQIDLSSVLQMVTISLIIGFRLEIYRLKKVYEQRTKVIELKFSSVQRDANKANSAVAKLSEKVSYLEAKVEILENFIIPKNTTK